MALIVVMTAVAAGRWTEVGKGTEETETMAVKETTNAKASATGTGTSHAMAETAGTTGETGERVGIATRDGKRPPRREVAADYIHYAVAREDGDRSRDKRDRDLLCWAVKCCGSCVVDGVEDLVQRAVSRAEHD